MLISVGPERRTYSEIAEWLKEEGYDTSKSAVGRYAKYLSTQGRTRESVLKRTGSGGTGREHDEDVPAAGTRDPRPPPRDLGVVEFVASAAARAGDDHRAGTNPGYGCGLPARASRKLPLGSGPLKGDTRAGRNLRRLGHGACGVRGGRAPRLLGGRRAVVAG